MLKKMGFRQSPSIMKQKQVSMYGLGANEQNTYILKIQISL